MANSKPDIAIVGAGIQMTPNAMKVLRGLGLEQHLLNVAYRPVQGFNRKHDTGEITNILRMGDEIEQLCGAPFLTMHRGDLHTALFGIVPPDSIVREKKLIGLERRNGRVRVTFTDGSHVEADAVVGADGVHSVVQQELFSETPFKYTGRVAYRTTYPSRLLNGLEIDGRCKWWGPDRHIVIYYVTRSMDELYFVTSTPDPDFRSDSWSSVGDLGELREAYRDFHPHVRAVLEACPAAHKWALKMRDPMPAWSQDNITLLGDACHPMTPYMAQGAASALEDAVVLSRCLEGIDRDGIAAAFRRYERTRQERTAKIQTTSAANDWMRTPTDYVWCYGYDAWSTPLA